METLRISTDSVAVALGAEEIAKKLEQQGHQVIRTGSLGISTAEPTITTESGLVYRNATSDFTANSEPEHMITC